MGEQSFVTVADRLGSDDTMELPVETDGTILLSTVQAQFPTAIGLKYKSSSGAWRGVRAVYNVLDAPLEMGETWGDATYVITESNALKRKHMDSMSDGDEVVSKARKINLLDDIIVLGLPYSTTEEELSKYFTDNCGELAFHELKYERDSKMSRGFGFIRFKTEEGAQEALNNSHHIGGRKLDVRMSKRPEENPTKLFMGRLLEGVTEDDVKTYFSEFQVLSDSFVPRPFRGIGFVTYASQEDDIDVIRTSHMLQGATSNVTAAETMNFGLSGNTWNMPNIGNMGNMGNMCNMPNMGNMGSNRPETPTRLFVGRLAGGTTNNEMTQYFLKFGAVCDCYVPYPFKGFGFVTFSYQEDAARVLNMNHMLLGSRIHVTPAEPKEVVTKQEVHQDNYTNYTWDPNKPQVQQVIEIPSPQYQDQGGPSVQKDFASELKDLLLTLISKKNSAAV